MAILIFVGLWLTPINYLSLQLVLPPLMLLLSFFVFSAAPRFIKLIHNFVASAILIGGLLGFIFMVFISSDPTSGDRAFLMIFIIGFGYALFALILLVWWATYATIQNRKA